MGTKVYDTLIRKGRNCYSEETVKHISELAKMICVHRNNETMLDAFLYPKEGYVIVINTTKAAYERFTEVVEHYYPQLCEFDRI